MAKTASALDRFKPAPSTAMPRILGRIVGPPGTGKTYFGLTGPAPIVVFSLDFGTEGTVDLDEFKDKDIRVVPIDWSPNPQESDQELRKQAQEIRDQFTEDYKVACEHARTVLVDKETELWNLVRYAEFGSPKGDIPRDFDKANQFMRMLINYPKKFPVNVLFIEDVRDEWSAATRRSGDVKAAGFREIEGLINVDLWQTRLGKGQFNTHVGKAKGPGAKTVQENDYNNLDISTLGQLIFPDTDDEDWQ